MQSNATFHYKIKDNKTFRKIFIKIMDRGILPNAEAIFLYHDHICEFVNNVVLASVVANLPSTSPLLHQNAY